MVLTSAAAFGHGPIVVHRPPPPPKAPPAAAQTPPPAATNGTTTPTDIPAPTTPGFVTNVFIDTDIRVAASEIASQAGVTIIIDDSIKSTNVNIEFKNTPINDAIDRLALFAAAVWKQKSEGIYLMSSGKPDAPLFSEFAVTRRYIPSNIDASALGGLLSPAIKDYVQVETKTNTLAITAPEQRMKSILAQIKAIDGPLRQFMVEALVAEVDANTSADLNFSWNWRNFALGSDQSLNYSQIPPGDVAYLKLLIGKQKATLRADPRLFASEGREGSISVGQDTYFPIITSSSGAFQSAQVELIHSGVTLHFTGFLGDDNSITLDLDAEVGDNFQTVASAPTTNTRKVTTTVRLKSGETLAIGGLVQENTTEDRTKIPFIGDIPLIGKLFTQQSETRRKLETVILVTPYLTEKGVGLTGADSSRPLLDSKIK